MNAHRLFPRLAAALALAALFSHSAPAAESNRIVVSGFQHPESVVHDTMLDLYLVSNVGVLPPSGFPVRWIITASSHGCPPKASY
jgi:hypothetical protein